MSVYVYVCMCMKKERERDREREREREIDKCEINNQEEVRKALSTTFSYHLDNLTGQQ